MGEVSEGGGKPPAPLLEVEEDDDDWSVAWGEAASSPRITRRW